MSHKGLQVSQRSWRTPVTGWGALEAFSVVKAAHLRHDPQAWAPVYKQTDVYKIDPDLKSEICMGCTCEKDQRAKFVGEELCL